MSRSEKALARLLTKPTDFTWSELCAVMSHFHYRLEYGSGSRRSFVHQQAATRHHMHEPHPGSILKAYQLRDVLAFLAKERRLP